MDVPRSRKSGKEGTVVNTWSALGVFLLGGGAGALLTAAFYSAQIRELKRLIAAPRAENSVAAERQNDQGNDVNRKSA